MARSVHRGPDSAHEAARGERITRLVRWHSAGLGKMGYHVERRRFGYYMRHVAGFGSVTVRDLRPQQAHALVADIRDYYGRRPVRIMVDDQQMDALLGPALEQAGCVRSVAQISLAHVGSPPEVRPTPGVMLEPLTPANLDEWVTTK